METIDKGQLHSSFNQAIYRWTLTLEPGKWLPVVTKTMPKEDFINAIKYLINCGEALEFKSDYSAFRRYDTTYLDFIGQ